MGFQMPKNIFPFFSLEEKLMWNLISPNLVYIWRQIEGRPKLSNFEPKG